MITPNTQFEHTHKLVEEAVQSSSANNIDVKSEKIIPPSRAPTNRRINKKHRNNISNID